jgi:hypothetical protein
LPSPFENVLSFGAKCYAGISEPRKRYVSDFFMRNSGSKVSSSMGSTPAHPEQNIKASRLPCEIDFLKDFSLVKQPIL